MKARAAARVVRGLYAVTPDCEDTELLVRQVRAALAGGARVVQYRNKTATDACRLAQAEALNQLCAGAGAALIVNDDVTLAAVSGADGVHLGREDGSVVAARNVLGRDALIGVSCYDSLARARSAEAEGADYVAFGSFFPSRVKPRAVRAPSELLTQARRELQVAIVAIGGITIDNGGELVAAGADALAVISALFDAPDVSAAAAGFVALFDHEPQHTAFRTR